MAIRFIRNTVEEDLVLIQPYFSQKQQAKQIGVCVNTMIDIRKARGLDVKPKGRPKKPTVIFKGEQEYPQAVEQAIQRLKVDVKIAKVLQALEDIEDKRTFTEKVLQSTDDSVQSVIEEYSQKVKNKK